MGVLVTVHELSTSVALPGGSRPLHDRVHAGAAAPMAGSGGTGEEPIITQIERVIVDPRVEDIVDPKVEDDVDLGAPASC